MPEALKFTDAEKDAFRKAYAPAGANDDQWRLFIGECERRALVPGVHVVFQLRSAKEFNKDLNKDVYVKKVTFITTINALRLIAQRDGHYEGHGPFVYYYGTLAGDFKESKVPLGKIPHAVSVEGYRNNWRVALFATARYDAYVQRYGEKNTTTQMWATRGEEQLAKCCEALMLRTVCPEECAGLLLSEEIANDTVDKEESTQPVTPVVVPLPITAPTVNQTSQAIYEPPYALNIEPVTVTQVDDTKATQPSEEVISKPTVTLTATNTTDTAHETFAFPPMSATPIEVTAPVVSPVDENTPASRKEYDAFLGRAAKLVRDKLPKGGLKDTAASNGVKEYMLRLSEKSGLKQLSKITWERLLAPLENAATPEDAVAIVKAAIAK